MIWFAAALAWCLVLFFGLGPVPALGPMLEVHNGVWQHENTSLQSQSLPGLKAEVVITFDQFDVPHIFAQSEKDLYLTQGFLTASQRLFQLDASTRQTAGRLTELFGEKALEFDEFFVRFGMRESAEISFKKYSESPEVMAMVDAYVRGINTYIERLPQLPPEYKILGRRPEPFNTHRVLHMGKALTWSLSGRSFDLQLTKYQQILGTAAVLDLFPAYLPDHLEDFVFPERLGKTQGKEDPGTTFVSALTKIPKFPLPNPGKGSNNWVVSPQKSATGRSLLANDTHLTLTLPNIWYELQLSTPEFNVYGVSLVGVPGIVNGFNKDLSWGPTNGATDVLDFYEIEFEHENSLRYKWNGDWEQAEVRQEIIRLKPFGQKVVEVVETKLGRLLHREGVLGLVADWTGHRPGQELRALRQQYTAKTVQECFQNFGYWITPIQNFVCADQKNIGWIHSGFVPKRSPGEGRFVMDGRKSTSSLSSSIERPQSINPPQGFLLSANQKIVPPDYPHYLGWDYEPPFRGMTIRRVLGSKDKHSVEDMINLQNENLDLQAEILLPKLLRHLTHEKLNTDQKTLVDQLQKWDFRIRAESVEPTLFKAWWKAFKEQLFKDDLSRVAGTPMATNDEERLLYPKDMRVAWLIERLEANPADSDGKWVDNKATAEIESLDQMVTAAYLQAAEDLGEKFGRDPVGWTWTKFNQSHFTHAGRLPGFGTDYLAIDGSSETVRGQGGKHGAVYKIIFAAGDWPEAWIQVPGGNEGDPFSPHAQKFVQEWVRGEMRKVEFYRDMTEAKTKATKVVYLKPEGGS